MIKRLLITGCSHGLGHELALCFSHLNCLVYAVGRNEILLRELGNQSSLIHPIIADIATEDGREKIYKAIDSQPLSIIHNAAMAKPAKFDSLPENLLREHFETNFFAPLLITRQLLSLLKNQRVLHISSGAAHLALPGLMPYCTTKTALEHATMCLNAELNAKEIYFSILNPGMMDTSMAEVFRNSKKESLPDVDFYINAKKENKLVSPRKIADFVAKVILETENTEFSQTKWGYRSIK